MRRRAFITLLGGVAAAWPLAARAQQPERMRRIGVLMNVPSDHPVGRARIAAFLQGLAQLGWTDGRNVRIEYRWAAGDAEGIRRYAAELAALAPEVILAPGSATAVPLLQATRTVPIVFVHATDPVGAGFVDSLARPGGNATGFTLFEYGISGKWLELLKEIANDRGSRHAGRDPALAAGIGQFAAIQSREGRDGAFDLAGVAHTDRLQLHTECRRYRALNLPQKAGQVLGAAIRGAIPELF